MCDLFFRYHDAYTKGFALLLTTDESAEEESILVDKATLGKDFGRDVINYAALHLPPLVADCWLCSFPPTTEISIIEDLASPIVNTSPPETETIALELEDLAISCGSPSKTESSTTEYLTLSYSCDETSEYKILSNDKEQDLSSEGIVEDEYLEEKLVEVEIEDKKKHGRTENKPRKSIRNHSQTTSVSSILAGQRLYEQAMEKHRQRGTIKQKVRSSSNQAPTSVKPLVSRMNTLNSYPKLLQNSKQMSRSAHSSDLIGERLFNQAKERKKRLATKKKSFHETNFQGETKVQDSHLRDIEVYAIVRGRRMHVFDGMNSNYDHCSSINRVLDPKGENTCVDKGGRNARAGRVRNKDRNNSSKPRYLQLYEIALQKSRRTGGSISSNQSTSTEKTTSTVQSTSSEKSSLTTCEKHRFDRLYSFSKKQRTEGKERRVQIQKSLNAKRQKPDYEEKKISPKDAENMYYRGVRQLLDLDNRRIEHAKMKQISYKPYRFNRSLKEKARQSDDKSKQNVPSLVIVKR
jgi:hypothetical protein